jgi:hypothetical protein
MVSPDAFEKLSIVKPDDFSDTELYWVTGYFPVLSFSEELLKLDGFIASRILSKIHERYGELWFPYGSFFNQNGKRYHVVLKSEQMPEIFAVTDWEILEWTTKIIHQF